MVWIVISALIIGVCAFSLFSEDNKLTPENKDDPERSMWSL